MANKAPKTTRKKASGSTANKRATQTPETTAGKPPKTTPDANTSADTARTPPDTGITMADLVAGYLAHLEDRGKGRGTVFSYSIDLAVATKHFGETTQLSSLTEQKIIRFFESDAVTKTRTGRAKVASTVAKTRRVLRLALVWAESEGLIPQVPVPAKYTPRRTVIA